MQTPTLQRSQTAATTGTTWRIDPSHSTIGFAVKHMMVATVRGRFNDFAGTIRFDSDHVDCSSVDVTIDTASIDTGIGPRDSDLRGTRFFDAESFPTATFHSTRVEGDHKRFVIRGELTIKGVTHEMALKAEYQGHSMDSPGSEVSGFGATGKLSRREYGLNWNEVLESGGVLVGDDVTLTIDVQADRIDS